MVRPRILILFAALLLAGCATEPATNGDPRDPDVWRPVAPVYPIAR